MALFPSNLSDGLDMKTAEQQPTNIVKKLIATTVALMAGACLAAHAADAKQNWDKSCAKCHGKDGKGQTKMGERLGIKDYTDEKVQAKMKDDEAFKAIKEGLKNKEGRMVMKPAEGLRDDEIKALVKHVRSFKK